MINTKKNYYDFMMGNISHITILNHPLNESISLTYHSNYFPKKYDCRSFLRLAFDNKVKSNIVIGLLSFLIGDDSRTILNIDSMIYPVVLTVIIIALVCKKIRGKDITFQ